MKIRTLIILLIICLKSGQLSASTDNGNGFFTHDLDCSAFAGGSYLVTLQTVKEQLAKKFVKNYPQHFIQ